MFQARSAPVNMQMSHFLIKYVLICISRTNPNPKNNPKSENWPEYEKKGFHLKCLYSVIVFNILFSKHVFYILHDFFPVVEAGYAGAAGS